MDEIGRTRHLEVVLNMPPGLARSRLSSGEAKPTLGPRKTLARAGRFLADVPVDQLHQSLKDLTAVAKGALLLTFKPPTPR